MTDIHWDQLGFIVGLAGVVMRFVARISAAAGSPRAGSLAALSFAMLCFGGFGILMVVEGTGQAGEMVRQGLLLLALGLVVYFLWHAWQRWPRSVS